MAVSGTAFQASRTHWQTVLYDALLIHPIAMKLFSLIVIQFSQFTWSSALKHRLTEMLRVCSNLVRLPGMTASSNDPLFGDVADVHLHRVKDPGGSSTAERFTSLSIHPFLFWWTIIPGGNISAIAVFCLKMTIRVIFLPLAVQPNTTVKLVFPWPIVQMVTLLAPWALIILFMEMSNVKGTLSMLMICLLPKLNFLV